MKSKIFTHLWSEMDRFYHTDKNSQLEGLEIQRPFKLVMKDSLRVMGRGTRRLMGVLQGGAERGDNSNTKYISFD